MAKLKPVWPGFMYYGWGFMFSGIVLFTCSILSSIVWLFIPTSIILYSITLLVIYIHRCLEENQITGHLFRGNQVTGHLFRGYERTGKVVGVTLMLFGNVALYYYSEKSIMSIVVFLFLAMYALGAMFLIQPYTDFGLVDFFLSASLNQAVSTFGIKDVFSWLVLIACVFIGGWRYWLEPKKSSGGDSNLNTRGGVIFSNQLPEGTVLKVSDGVYLQL